MLDRLGIYALSLHSTEAWIASSRDTTRTEWTTFVDIIDVEDECPGLLGFAFVERVVASQVNAFESRVRESDLPGFATRILPSNVDGDDHAFVLYSEPIGQDVIGTDLLGVTDLDAALINAAESGRITMSSSLSHPMLPDNWDIVLCVPIYDRSRPLSTPTQRKDATRGWVAAPLNLTELFDALPFRTLSPGQFDVRLDQVNGERVYLSSASFASMLEEASTVNASFEFGGTTLFVRIETESNQPSAFAGLPGLALVLGLIITALLALITFVLHQTRHRARQLAERMTRSYEGSLRQLKAAHRELTVQQSMIDQHVMVAITDAQGRIAAINSLFEQALGVKGSDIIGQSIDTFFDPVEPEPRGGMDADSPDDEPVDQYESVRQRERTFHSPDGEQHWVDTAVVPDRAPDGTIERYFHIQTDVTERHRYERNRTLMMRELDHRVKNNLAAIASLTRQTLKTSDSLEAFETAFLGRLHALARTHEALAAANWSGVELSDVIRRSAAPIADRMTFNGPAIVLPAAASTPLSLVMHELATNALRHGSLRRAEGRVDVTWSLNGDRLQLDWRETGGPEVSEPERRGLGLSLIDGLIRHELKGSVTVDFATPGAHCSINCRVTPAE